MPITPDSEIAMPSTLALPEILDLKAAAPLAGEFLTLRGSELRVDATRVQRLGGQCLQVLLSAAMTWKADELPFVLINPSDDFLDGLARLGISADDFINQDTHH